MMGHNPQIATPGEQLGQLLPPDLAAALAADEPAPEALERALALLRGRLAAMAPLIPPPILRQQLLAPRRGQSDSQRWSGSLLFADLSGFTALSEQLSSLGREGSEVTTGVINRLFGGLTEQVSRYGGALLKFGGDALTAFFSADELGEQHAALAAGAALGMHERMAEIGMVETRAGRHVLRLRTGVHSGSLVAAQLGDQQNMELLITGHAVNRVAQAQDVARPGEIVLTDETVQQLQQASVVPRGQGFSALVAFRPPQPQAPAPLPALPASGDMAELRQLASVIAALELFLPQGLAESGLVDAAALASGFRRVSVLFAHVTSLSTLLELLPPGSDPAALLNGYYWRMQQAVEQYGGSVNKLDLAADGDKLLACFGAPIAQERHQELAVRAALAMQRELQAVNQELAARGLPVLSQRIGINTGHVFAGLVGTPQRREYTVMGDVVNLAARLMADAPAGAIWISPALERRVSSIFRCRLLPPRIFKGKTEPMRPAMVLGLRKDDRHRREQLMQRSPLVGREGELAVLHAAAGTALHGAGRSVVLIGEAGIGKSRLIEDFISQLSLQSMQPDRGLPVFRLLTTECQSYEQTIPFASLRDQLLQLLQLPAAGQPPEQRAELARRRVEELVPRLARFVPLLGEVLALPLPETPLTSSLGPEQRRDRTHELVIALFAAAAAREPIVMVWDDLHWGDASSLELLQQLVRSAGRYPLLLLLGMRPEPALYSPLVERVTLLQLEELGAADGAALARTLLQGDPPPALLERLQTANGGANPFFVEELLRSLVELGVLAREPDGSWGIAGDLEELELPHTIEDVIAARVDQLEARQRETLQTAAVIGRRFLRPILEGVAENREGLLQQLAGLTESNLILQDQPSSYLFKHMLTRDTVYASILYARRRELHRRVAGRIEEVFVDRLDEQLPLLARHYYAAEDWLLALRYSLEAGRRDQERFHNREALALFEMALEALAHLEPQPVREAELHERVGLAHLNIGDYEQAQAALEQALAILKAQPEPDQDALAGAVLHLARLAERRSDYDTAFHYVEYGFELAQQVVSPQLAPLLLMKAGLYHRQGRYAADAAWAQRALEVAKQANSRRDMAHAYYHLTGTYGKLGLYQAAVDMGEQSLAIYQELGDLAGQAVALANTAIALTELGQNIQAVQYYQAALELEKALGNLYNQALDANNLGDLLRQMGAPDEAMEQFTLALKLFERLGSQYGIAVLHMNIGSVCLSQQQLQQAHYHLEHSDRLFRAIGAEGYMPELYRYRAELALAEHQPLVALEYADQSLHSAHRVNARAEIGMTERLRGAILHAMGDPAQAVEALRTARVVLSEVGNKAELLRCIEALARLTPDGKEAQALSDEAQQLRCLLNHSGEIAPS